MNDTSFTPALGSGSFTGAYDLAIRLLTRERHWRQALLAQVAVGPGETILDVGCGTGSFAIMLKQAAPKARVIGLDPDPQVLEIAANKAKRAGVAIDWRRGFARDAADFAGRIDKAVSSLVFHQVPTDGKREGLAAMFAAVKPRGEVHVADYARQPGLLMRTLFRLTVQMIDGSADTQPNVDGALETELAALTGRQVGPTQVIATLTGAISLFRATRSNAGVDHERR